MVGSGQSVLQTKAGQIAPEASSCATKSINRMKPAGLRRQRGQHTIAFAADRAENSASVLAGVETKPKPDDLHTRAMPNFQ